MGNEVPSLRDTSRRATSGELCSSQLRLSAQDRKGPAMEKPASSRKASRDMPMSAWSSTIMQQGLVIATDLSLFGNWKSPTIGGSRRSLAGADGDNTISRTLPGIGHPLTYPG